MENTTRRSVVKGAAWTVPVVSMVVTAPAFAASRPLTCGPTAECKQPGEGTNTKDYTIRTNCTSQNGSIAKVEIWDNVQKKWIAATAEPDGTWTAYDFNDSRRDRQVRITDSANVTQIYNVSFPPC